MTVRMDSAHDIGADAHRLLHQFCRGNATPDARPASDKL
jgi:hypothetical protein